MRRMLATKFVNWIKSLYTKLQPSGTAGVRVGGTLNVDGSVTSNQEKFATLTPTDEVSTLNYIFSRSIQNEALYYFHFEVKVNNDQSPTNIFLMATSDKSLGDYHNICGRANSINTHEALIIFKSDGIYLKAVTPLTANEVITGTVEFFEK